MDLTAGLVREMAHGNTEIVQDRDLAGLRDRMYGVEPKSVEMIIAKPIQRVLDYESAHLWHTVIDRAPPRGMRLREERRRITVQVISLGAEVVVDDVEKHHQPAQMRFVDQRLEIFGAAVGAVGRVPQYAVISPVAWACEVSDRHQLQRGDAARHQMIELGDHGAVGTLGRKGADMGFQQHRFVPGAPTPLRGAPSVARVIDY